MEATPLQPIATFQHVTKTFAQGKQIVRALSRFTASIETGRVTGLIGPDGAGKTTSLRILAGLYTPDVGTVRVLDRDVATEALAVQARVGYMPQRFGLYEDLTVRENLDLYADLQGVSRAVRTDRYRELMEMTGLAPFPNRLAGKLSGGMKQKLGLACVLVQPPALLLLDEPTVGVDPVSRRELWQIIDRYVRDRHTTVLVSTGYLDEAERCDWLIVLDGGKLLRQGTPESFCAPLRDKTFKIRVRGMPQRDIQARLDACAQVADAVVQGESVRVVTYEKTENPCHGLFADQDQVALESVPPRFEDAFVMLLGSRQQDRPQASADGKPAAPRLPTRDTGLHAANSCPATGSPQTSQVIQVEGVKRRFGDFYAVKGVTFDVQRGEIFGLLGANGAGKTTTFRMLCGLLPASAGKLFVAGVDVRRTAARARQRIGYMAQKFSLYGALSVVDNLRFFSCAYRLRGAAREERIGWALRQFELEEVAAVASGSLPLGFKQRLSFACALMHEPEILFLDEPTSGVDPLARREFWRRTGDLANQGVTVLVTTHYMEEAENCDRVAIMAAGDILALDTPEAIKQKMKTVEKPTPTMEDAFIELLNTRRVGKT